MTKRRRTDNIMPKRRRTDNIMTKRRRTDNIMPKRRRTDKISNKHLILIRLCSCKLGREFQRKSPIV
jgi:hypothetical protein